VSDLKSDLAALKLERSPERSGRAAVRLLVLLPLAALGAGAWMWITRERPFAVIVSVLAEALGLAAAGGLLGGLLVYAAFNGYQTSTINVQTFSQVAFAFAVTPALLVQGLAYALVMGLAGGVLPAIKAARLPISSALREL
jgi:putative ABC transport system permease protein